MARAGPTLLGMAVHGAGSRSPAPGCSPPPVPSTREAPTDLRGGRNTSVIEIVGTERAKVEALQAADGRARSRQVEALTASLSTADQMDNLQGRIKRRSACRPASGPHWARHRGDPGRRPSGRGCPRGHRSERAPGPPAGHPGGGERLVDREAPKASVCRATDHLHDGDQVRRQHRRLRRASLCAAVPDRRRGAILPPSTGR